MLVLPLTAKGQITIGGNVYGGGNEGYVSGNTTVTVRAGNIGARSTDSEEPVRHPAGKVFGGARMANVGGNAFVHIDGEHASDSMVINHVYGGNDIAGIIGDNPNAITRLPKELKDAQTHSVDSTWNSFVLVTTKADTVAGKAVEVSKAPKIFIGQLFGGGNGDYAYEDVQDEDSVTHNIYAKPKLSSDDPVAWKKTPKGDAGFVVPDLAKSYLDIHGGTITYAYGGGNNATVTEKNVICVNNPSGVVVSICEGDENLLTTPRFKEMGINTSLSHPTSDEFQIGCLFGGNNKDTMDIRPTWYLQDGSVRSLFSGGNRGAMIYEHGLYLNIPETSTIVVNDLFGGCRMADVRPQKKNPTTGVYEDVDEVDNDIVGYNFPRNLAARVLIAGGDVRNVYGGNDVRGKVYFGNAIGIHASVRGNVYGGGNGAYAYTDISDYENDDIWGDYYYTGNLNDIRPNAEQVSILLRGTEEKKTIIGGSVFVGGNCATLKADEKHKNLANYPLAELKIGSHVIAKNVFLGNNGESMVSEDILKRYDDGDFSTMTLQEPSVFSEYMKAVTLSHLPRMIAEDTKKGDRMDYIPYTSYIGSLYYGGNRGSMTYPGTLEIDPEVPLYIYDKLVGGCNNAIIPATEYNARYEGGILGSDSEQLSYTDESGNIKDRIHMNLSKIKLLPMRLNDEGTGLEWNTYNLKKFVTTDASSVSEDTYVPEKITTALATGTASEQDKTRRLKGGNVYGGCNESGHVNGNVVISLKGTLHDRHAIFDAFEGEEEDDDILYDFEDYTITNRKSGVILNEQGMDVLGEALNVYGGGKGKDTQIWGSTTVNLERGYTFQIFGGSENGVIGKVPWHERGENDPKPTGYDYPTVPDAKYSATVNINGQRKGVARQTDSSEEMAEAEFVYGGNNTGLIIGNTHVNLNNGRIFNSWGGSCNADILGYAETRVGENGFPYFRDHIYGANDLGGQILGTKDFSSRVSNYEGDKAKIFGYSSDAPTTVPDVLTASAYVEFIQGNTKNIFGGCFGEYDYDGKFKDVKLPWLDNAFVNIRPANNNESRLGMVFGAGQGSEGNFPEHVGDFMQDRSYVLVDIPQTMTNFTSTAIFGAGRSNGLGMREEKKIEPKAEPAAGASYEERREYNEYLKNLHKVSAIVDLVRGQIGNVYGGSYEEGIVRSSVVNVPAGSTIEAKNIFGGGYGVNVDVPCDVYQAQVNYNSEHAAVKGIYGGNNNADRTLYTQVNIRKPVWQDKEKTSLATVYGAGYGEDTWAQYTEVNLLSGAQVASVYGGGYNGKVINLQTLKEWDDHDSDLELGLHDYTDNGLNNALAKNTALGGKYNTNVHINEGATVAGYAYGGGLGSDTIPNSGNVYGTTYIDVLGGTVTKDLSAAGTTGSVQNWFREGKNTTGGYKADGFTASATAYIQGGTVRNVYGGGYRGNVGWHDGKIYENVSVTEKPDVPGKSYVVIGKLDGKSHVDGIPSITRNVYGGGEGGAVYGCANIKVNNGYIGYRYDNDAYVEELHDKAPGDSLLAKGGNIFGGGYVANSYVDSTHIEMYGGVVRGSLHGGGEIGPVGRGTMLSGAAHPAGALVTEAGATIYKAGKTLVQLYDGWVKRDIFGGGRGYDNWGGEGWMTEEEKATMDRSAKGYVFGQTEVDIYGGEVGTDVSVALGEGNVFGGGDIGFVHSAYENSDHQLSRGKKDGKRFDNSGDGYYYKYEGDSFVTVASEKVLTEDCKVLVEPWCKANSDITPSSTTYKAGSFVPTSALNYLGNKNDPEWQKVSKTDPNKEGIIIHNAVFAGGNTSAGSAVVHANTTTVYGNATASINDVYHRDLITIGTGHTGGLYGDGNLTLVDGYRELNITNYGTDYYSITPEITRAQYDALPKREGAYYEIRYKCKKSCKDKDGKTYGEGSTITYDDLIALFLRFNVSTQKYESLTDNSTPILKYNETTKSWEPNNDSEATTYWIENGVCSRYAGRIMNTIQRADFCGVFGSRMVMQGAQDRVPETVDYTNYTINRVREVSLNKKVSLRSIDTDSRDKQHGNYFGIYNTVNYLGALTSDVDFGGDGATSAAGAVRTTENDDKETYQCNAGDGGKAYGTATYYDWKAAFHNDRKRNNGSSYNKVALSSGVYLELTTEQSKGDSLYGKDWGYITGVVELDLINVQPGVGGGFVYAKNVHGKRYPTGLKQLTLTKLNEDAVSRKKYRYDEDDTKKEEWQTSGNFVHSSQTIIDDCYNKGGKYKSQYKAPDGVPAHYWYIKGSIYVYDQYISAYTGTPNAYSEVVNIPLTITSASHGKMTLMNIMPNRYAYYSNHLKEKLGPTEKLILRDVEYKLNDPISYWDYCLLSKTERELFVEQTYVTTDSCKVSDKYYPKGYVMLRSEYEGLEDYAKNHKQVLEEDMPAVPAVLVATKDGSGADIVKKDDEGNDVYKAFSDVFHESNNMRHETGYLLTYKVNNPELWDTWYSPKTGDSQDDKITTRTYNDKTTVKANYENGPTYTPQETGLYGQEKYLVGNIISEDIYNTYQTAYANSDLTAEKKAALGKQATFESAWVVTADILETQNKNNVSQRFYKGAALVQSNFTTEQWSGISGKVAPAYVVTNTITLGTNDYIYRDTRMTESEKTTLYNKYNKVGATDEEKQIAAEISKFIVPAYYCTGEGAYGGELFKSGNNYRAMSAFCNMSAEDRQNFIFNYDALDLLVDSAFTKAEGAKYQYDGYNTTTRLDYSTADEAAQNKARYSLQTPIDYTATFKAPAETPGASITYIDDNNVEKTATNGTELSRTEFERLLNERYYYSPISVRKDKATNQIPEHYYIVNRTIVLGDTPYAAGQVISKDTYEGLGDDDKTHVTVLHFPAEGTYFYCREGYDIATGANGGHAVTNATDVTATQLVSNDEGHTYTSIDATVTGTYSPEGTVPVGLVIDEGTYKALTNKQANFTIHGTSPTETSTLYVTRNSDINDLSSEKIITVIYQYDYVETDMGGMNITPVSERHILNIHINFKSGVPTVENILAPEIVLPGTSISIKEPFVSAGAYEVTGGGWELFDNDHDAESHSNGVEYTPNNDPLFLYQDSFLVAYYAKTYLGKTYSNAVPVRVANYHDLKKVMSDLAHHYYIDHKDLIEKRKIEPKIYINDYSKDAEGSKNGLDLFKDLYDLTVLSSSPAETTSPIYGHTLLNKSTVGGGKNLEFFLRTDIDHSTATWTPIGSTDDDGPCFDGTFHGDGHYLSGLDHSLFNHLCGDVFNLGVSGTFTGAGIAEAGSGYLENCWMSTTSTATKTHKPVFNTPSRTSEQIETRGPIQIVNCYYAEEDNATNKYTNHAANSIYGAPVRKPAKSFYNGEVAYDLNGFYLFKRYSDHQSGTGVSYNFWKNGETALQTGKYFNSDASICSTGNGGVMYVEDRFADGDFIYDGGNGGVIPTVDDVRLHTYKNSNGETVRKYYPIWPDDYLYFGQSLNYGYVDGLSHDSVPSAIKRSGNYVATDMEGNRVYRAPAYFRNDTMRVAHFNPNAIFAQTGKNQPKKVADKGMTAIDFTDKKYGSYPSYRSYAAGWIDGTADGLDKMFYPPLLDDDGLTGFRNADLTQNLLVYTAATGENKTAAEKTATVVSNYLLENVYEESGDKYRNVAYQTSASVHGHWVENGIATRSHQLVDKQDFNAPLSYKFNDGLVMWYQRYPDDNEFVDRKKGWQAISLPFTAELVTTDQKGEITHFYSGSETSKNGTGTKIGHEYWLREMANGSTMAPPEGQEATSVLTATFNHPTSKSSDLTKTVQNTFLWDHYYKGVSHNQRDYNNDTYQDYYSASRSYPQYPLLAKGTPYLLGLPGATYFEFDLSGSFDATTTATTRPAKIEKQTITFVSNKGATISVSDKEAKTSTATYGNTNYLFKPSYLNMDFEAETPHYVLADVDTDSDGKTDVSRFNKVSAATSVYAFRPYFMAVGDETRMTRSIGFGMDADEMNKPQAHKNSEPGTLTISAGYRSVIVESALRYETEVRVVTTNGVTLNTFKIKPGEIITTRVNLAGVYIVQTTDQEYTKKIAVK